MSINAEINIIFDIGGYNLGFICFVHNSDLKQTQTEILALKLALSLTLIFTLEKSKFKLWK